MSIRHGVRLRLACAQGAHVWLADVREAELQQSVQACLAAGAASAQGVIADVSDREQVTELFRQAGDTDILVNVAGGVLGQVGQPIEDVTAEQWQAILDVNLTGTFNCSQAAVPGMRNRGGGRIINISSGAGLRISLTGIQAYASAKAGQIGFTRQLAHEVGKYGITVNNIAPGFVLSNPTTERQWASYGEEGQQRLVNSISTRRLGRPEDIANAVLFFASDASGWVSGQVLAVDGGHF